MDEISAPSPVVVTGFRADVAAEAITPESIDRLALFGTIFGGAIRQLTFSPDGDLVVVCGLGARLLDPDTLAEKAWWWPEHHIVQVAFTDAGTLVVAGRDLGIDVFLTEPGAELETPWVTSTHPAERVGIDSAGKRLAIPRPDGIDVHQAGKAPRALTLSPDIEGQLQKPWVEQGIVSPDGRYALAYAPTSLLVAWDIETGQELLADALFDAPDAVCFLPDSRLIRSGRSLGMFTVSSLDRASPSVDVELGGRRVPFVGGDRLLGANGFGQYSVHSLASFERLEDVEAETHGGAIPSQTVGAISDTHVAVYAESYGELRVHGSNTVTARDHVSELEALSVSKDGRRVVAPGRWLDTAYVLDLDRAEKRSIRAPDSLAGAAISPDGAHVLFGSGVNRGPRTIKSFPFSGGAIEERHKTLAWVGRIETFGIDGYAIATNTLGGAGYVSVHRVGAARAIAKIKHEEDSPWVFDVSEDGVHIVVAWETATTVHTLDNRAKLSESFTSKPSAVAVANGVLAFVERDDGDLVLSLRSGDDETLVPLDAPGPGHRFLIALSRDASLVFVGRRSGVLEVRRTSDGSVVRSLRAHAGRFMHLRCIGDRLWSLGADGVVRAYALVR